VYIKSRSKELLCFESEWGARATGVCGEWMEKSDLCDVQAAKGKGF